MTAACPSSLGADLSRRRTSGPLVFPNGKGPGVMAQQLRAEREPDEAGSLRELRAYLAGLPLQRDHLAESLQGEVREQGQVLASAIRCGNGPPERVDHRRLESHDTIK